MNGTDTFQSGIVDGVCGVVVCVMVCDGVCCVWCVWGVWCVMECVACWDVCIVVCHV